jgi:hypothetical protein
MDQPYSPPEASSQTPLRQYQPSTSGLAIASLVCGVCSLLLSVITGIPAIIMGHIARSNIKASGGAIGGKGMALAGLILGYLTSLIPCVAVLAGLATPAILKAKKSADQVKLIQEMKIVGQELHEFGENSGRYPTGDELLITIDLPAVTSGVEGPWVYFPNASAGGTKTPLLISPFSLDQAAILYTDQSITKHREDQVTKILQAFGSESIEFEATIKTK